MARRRQRLKPAGRKSEQVPRRVVRHVSALGLGSLSSYRSWCRAHGRPDRLDKSWAQLEVELAIRENELKARRERSRIVSHPMRLLDELCHDRIAARQLPPGPVQDLARCIEAQRLGKRERGALLLLLHAIHERADFLTEPVAVGGVRALGVEAAIGLSRRRRAWLRPLEVWRPRTHNPRRQLGELIRYLLAEYPVPGFMDAAWLRPNDTAAQDWFIWMGRGKSIRKARTPIPLTRKMAHHFLEAPEHCSIVQALRWGQVRGLGGGDRLAHAIVTTRLGDRFEHEGFWLSVIRFFVEHPMLDRAQVGPIVDYLHDQRFEERDVWVERGVREAQPPPQPNLSMRGRTPESLLRQVERWHRELGRAARSGALQWERSKIGELCLETGRAGHNLKIWRIRELLSSRELLSEGRAMRHCVATYARSCKAGRCSIWAMELESFEGVEKRQTVEVDAHGSVVQCRGRLNRLPTPQELLVLRRWAEREGLQIRKWILERE